jgi:hypothetical protein
MDQDFIGDMFIYDLDAVKQGLLHGRFISLQCGYGKIYQIIYPTLNKYPPRN